MRHVRPPRRPALLARAAHRRERVVMTAAAAFAAALVLALLAAPLARADDHPQPAVSEAQVEEGKAIYAQSCSMCHGAALEGLGSFPVLAGAPFQARWDGRPLGELFGFVRENMPLGAGGSLEPEAYAAAVAFILERNGIQPGDDAFGATDEEALGVVLGFGE